MIKAPQSFAIMLFAFTAMGMAQAVPGTESPVAGRVDLIDMAVDAETILSATVTKTRTIPQDKSPGLAPGYRRLLVDAEVDALLTARGSVPAEIKYLVDLPEDARGRAPNIREQRVLLFLGREYGPGEFALAHKYGQQPWTSERETDVRRFVTELADPKLNALAPTEVVSAFHVPGSLPGESESQVFLQTEAEQPMSLVILNRPGETPRYAVATGDIIDPNAGAPAKGSVVALGMACDLPAALPDDVLEEKSPSERAALEKDFAFVREQLGECERRF